MKKKQNKFTSNAKKYGTGIRKIEAERIRQYEAYAEGVVSQETYLKNKKDLNEKIEIIQDKYEQIQEVTSVEDDLMKDIRIVEKNAEEVNILKKMTRYIAETICRGNHDL